MTKLQQIHKLSNELLIQYHRMSISWWNVRKFIGTNGKIFNADNNDLYKEMRRRKLVE